MCGAPVSDVINNGLTSRTICTTSYPGRLNPEGASGRRQSENGSPFLRSRCSVVLVEESPERQFAETMACFFVRGEEKVSDSSANRAVT